jgi:hypothetical protein
MIFGEFGDMLHGLACVSLSLVAIQETKVLWPRYIDENVEPVLLRLLQKRSRRHVIGPQTVDRCRAHRGEIRVHLFRRGKRVAIVIDGEGTVSNALQTKPIVAANKELAVDARSFSR